MRIAKFSVTSLSTSCLIAVVLASVGRSADVVVGDMGYKPLLNSQTQLEKDQTALQKTNDPFHLLAYLAHSHQVQTTAKAQSISPIGILTPPPFPPLPFKAYPFQLGNGTTLNLVDAGYNLTPAEVDYIEVLLRQLPADHLAGIHSVVINLNNDNGGGLFAPRVVNDTLVIDLAQVGADSRQLAFRESVSGGVGANLWEHLSADDQAAFLSFFPGTVYEDSAKRFPERLFYLLYDNFARDSNLSFEDALSRATPQLAAHFAATHGLNPNTVSAHPELFQAMIFMASQFTNKFGALKIMNHDGSADFTSAGKDTQTVPGITILNIGTHYFVVKNNQIVGETDRPKPPSKDPNTVTAFQYAVWAQSIAIPKAVLDGFPERPLYPAN